MSPEAINLKTLRESIEHERGGRWNTTDGSFPFEVVLALIDVAEAATTYFYASESDRVSLQELEERVLNALARFTTGENE